jgi:hypothetical protein
MKLSYMVPCGDWGERAAHPQTHRDYRNSRSARLDTAAGMPSNHMLCPLGTPSYNLIIGSPKAAFTLWAFYDDL